VKQIVDEFEASNGRFFYFPNKKETNHCQLLGIVIEHAILYVEAMKIDSGCSDSLPGTKDEKKSPLCRRWGRGEKFS
jgi:hypothetical protein